MEPTDAFTADDYAPFGRRVVAFLIDVPMLAVVTFVVFIAMAIANGGELDLEEFGMLFTWLATGVAWEVLWIAGPARGKPGQLLAGFRVVGLDGTRVPVARAVIRWAVRVTTFVLFPFGLIAQVVTIAASQRNQAVHDVFAGTVCVERAALEQVRSVQHIPTAAERATPVAAARDSDATRHQGPFL